MLYYFLFLLIGFLGGVLSLLSPCSGVLLPSFFALIFKSKKSLFLNTLFFSLGVLILALPLGIGSAFIFSFFLKWGKILFKSLGIFFILVSLLTLIGSNLLPHLNFLQKARFKKYNYLSSFSFGFISALSLGTCSGPILGAIATLAGSSQSRFFATILMFFYTLGILTPFLLIAFGVDKSNYLKKIFVKGKLLKISIGSKVIFIHSTNIISALLFLFLGIIFYFYSASLLSFETSLNINVDKLLNLQDNLLNLLN